MGNGELNQNLWIQISETGAEDKQIAMQIAIDPICCLTYNQTFSFLYVLRRMLSFRIGWHCFCGNAHCNADVLPLNSLTLFKDERPY